MKTLLTNTYIKQLREEISSLTKGQLEFYLNETIQALKTTTSEKRAFNLNNLYNLIKLALR